MTWKKAIELKKKLDQDMPSEEYIVDRLANIESVRDRYFLALIYYTGCRITEAIEYEDITRSHKFSKMMSKTVDVVEIQLPNRKAKTVRRKIIPLNLEIEKRPELIIDMYEYMKMIKNKKNRWGFNTKQRGWQIFQEHTAGWFSERINPHLFRHLRLSHLARRGFDADKRKKLAGHSSIASQQPYIHLDISDLF